MESFKFLVVLGLFGVSFAEIVNFQQCSDTESSCEIHEVRITPCPEAASGQNCKIKRGNSATLEFDYTPSFSAESLIGDVFWATDTIDLPFMGMDSEACKFTPCPVVASEKKTYVFTLPIGKKLPTKKFDIKWRLTGDEDTEKTCCFITYIQLIR